MSFQIDDAQDRKFTVHHFKPVTGHYDLTELNVIIKAGEGLPALSTIESLPTIPEGHSAYFDIANSVWLTDEDHIGDMAYPKDSSTHDKYEVEVFGPIPDTHTLLVPSENDSWDGTKWEEDAVKVNAKLATIRNNRKEYMREQAKSEIASSFTSNALGTTHTYDSRSEDQNNLTQAQNEAELANPQEALVYANNGTEFDYRTHTLAQIKQVSADCSLHIRPIRIKLIAKKAAIDSANTESAINAINW